jgi:hypothetical protein
MKKIENISLLLLTGILLIGCGGGSDDTVDPPKENQAPTKVASLTYPTNNLLCITNTLNFEWSASTDPDGDSVFYLLEISKDNQFSTLDQSITVSGNSKTVTLEKGIAYYWRVKARDNKNLESDYSSIHQFYTEGLGETNHLPFAPELIAPETDAIINNVSTNLQWNATDVDNDPLTYDVYFGTVNPPTTKVGDNISVKNLNVDLNAATTYYWKVVTKDDKGGASIGQVWSFSSN